MTINEEQPQPGAEPDAAKAGPGDMLRQARESRGWSQNEVARRLNLRVAVIESIDGDHYKAGVAMTFLRGYVKAYARLVGANEQQALAAFDGMAGMEQLRSAGPAPMQSFSKKTRQQASDKWLKRISWLVLLGLLTSLVFWWWQNSGVGYVTGDTATEQSLPAEPAPADEPAPRVMAPEITTPDVVVPGVATPADGSLPEAEAPTPDTAPAEVADIAVTAGASAEPAQAEPVIAPQPEPTADPELLVLGFTADCWIKITDAEGRVLSEGVKTAADRLELKGQPPFRLVLGAPQAASVEYLNRAVDLSSFRAGRVARLTVPQS
ncbi:cytoskeleton protein RodZ [Oceanimonas sp. CHS3-5]|uniref:cytoskeleton protein RodZ n=1 Tax=Oceanimonas sp. CHS3-5 TaxID=3068186 RepID=UPI00273EEE59|nr:cytoskeleton protein RodZ [Oceanimonas sp. CHS3-5]MDP5292752.1 cytoskeleton protein RodZ [Oceanimonas sp. CHS3-5]